jgi:hypothetical protein
VEGYESKINRLWQRGDLTCLCWDHLRAAGITPNTANAERYRSSDGKIYCTNDGTVNRDRTKSFNKVSEAERVMVKGRGQNA